MSHTPAETVASTLPERAKALRPLLEEQAPASEQKGELTRETVEALHRERLFAIWVPRELGGWELDPISSIGTIEELTYADPSVGWVVMAAALSTGTAGAYLGDEAVGQLFARGKNPVIAGQGSRPGTAIAEDGGHRISGNWSFASGLLHSSHIHTAALVEGTNERRIFVLPVDQAELLGNWDVMGLRATGSIDYRIDDLFVPEPFSHSAAIGIGLRGGPVYTIGLIGFASIGHTSWALGIARRLLDELISMVHEKAGRAGAQGQSESFLEELETHEGRVRASRSLTFEIWHDVWATVERGDALTRRQQTLIRLAMTHATSAADGAAEFAYHRAGTVALRRGRMQQLFRDMHAGSQHGFVAPATRINVARELAGLADDKRWLFLQLADAVAE